MPKGVSLWPDGRTSSSIASIAGLWHEMETECRCKVQITFASLGTPEAPDLEARLSLLILDQSGAVVNTLAWKKFQCLAQNVANLEALLFFLLYQADSMLAQHELGGDDSPA